MAPRKQRPTLLEGRQSSLLSLPDASPVAWWWEWEVENPKQPKQTTITTKTRGQFRGCLWTLRFLFVFKLELPEGGGEDKNYLYSWIRLSCREIR